MIIVLKDADFSANNIGQVKISLHPFTERIFNHCTRFSADSEVAQSVNKFILALDEQGVLEHLGFFVAPWLASNLGEAVYDVANDTSLSYDPELTYEGDGIISVSANKKGMTLSEVIPTENFFGEILDYASPFPISPFFLNEYNKPCLFGNCGNGSWISQTFNYSTPNGYSPLSPLSITGCLFNITELSNLDSGNTTINGSSVVANSGYSKENEPFNNTIYKFVPCLQSNAVRSIIFAGDGTTLNSTQITAVISAINTLRSEITEVE